MKRMRDHSSGEFFLQKTALYFRFHPDPAHVRFVLDKIILG